VEFGLKYRITKCLETDAGIVASYGERDTNWPSRASSLALISAAEQLRLKHVTSMPPTTSVRDGIYVAGGMLDWARAVCSRYQSVSHLGSNCHIKIVNWHLYCTVLEFLAVITCTQS